MNVPGIQASSGPVFTEFFNFPGLFCLAGSVLGLLFIFFGLVFSFVGLLAWLFGFSCVWAHGALYLRWAGGLSECRDVLVIWMEEPLLHEHALV